MGPIYENWNQKLNLISRKDIKHLYLRHVLHSLSITKVVAFRPGSRILDVGTGGGFPGIPLAIMFPEAQFHLIDSVGKKINAVRHIAEELGLVNVATFQIRAERVEQQYDFILGRAVTQLNTFYGWLKDKLAPHAQHDMPNGFLYLQGDQPLHLPIQQRTYPLSHFFDEPFFEHKQLVYLMRAQR